MRASRFPGQGASLSQTRYHLSRSQYLTHLRLEPLEDRRMLSSQGFDFPEQQQYAVGGGPCSVTAADVNGDGAVDLVTANVSGSVSVLRNLGDGAFADQVTYAVGGGPLSVTAADVNGDGAVDLVTANVSGSVSVLRNLGDGTFAAQVNYAVGNYPESVTAADVNGDGAVDLVTANAFSNSVSVLRNLGDGTFAAQVTYAVGYSPRSVTAADVNGDGAVDLVAANFYSGSVSVLRNLGDGTFAAQVDYAVGDSPYSVTAADVNGDGAVDLVTVNYYSDCVSVLRNLGDGAFAAQVIYAVGDDPLSVKAADVNGDGAVDLVTANYVSNNVTVLRNFVVPPTADAGGHYSVIEGNTVTLTAAGSTDPGNDIVSYNWDLDNDGQYDDASGVTVDYHAVAYGVFTVAVCVTDDDGAWDTDSAQVTVLAANPYPGDADRDGTVDSADAAILGNNWLKQSGAVWADGDFNNDGRVDDRDAVILAVNMGRTLPTAVASSATEPLTLAIEPEMETESEDPALLPGDASGDGTVDNIDAAILIANWQKQSGAVWADGDFTGDGRIDDNDAKLLAINWRKTLASAAVNRINCMSEIVKEAAEPAVPAACRTESIPLVESALKSTPQATAAATDVALTQEFGPQLEQLNFQRQQLAWTHAYARRQFHGQDNRILAKKALAVDMLLSNPGV